MNELCSCHLSFSQLAQAEQCPYSYYLTRIAGVEPKDNAFAQAGSLVHQILAGWARGEIAIHEMPVVWTTGFPTYITECFPPYLEAKGYRQKLRDSVSAYFQAFDGFPGYEIIGAEQAFTSSLAGESFVGVIDLILRDRQTGEYVLVDHKSSSLSSFKRSRHAMYRQLLLYSKYIADHFGTFPARLQFNLFRESLRDEQPFRPEDYMEAVRWAEKAARAMNARDLPDWFELRPEQFYCTQLCPARGACSFGCWQNHHKGADHNEKQPVPA